MTIIKSMPNKKKGVVISGQPQQDYYTPTLDPDPIVPVAPEEAAIHPIGKHVLEDKNVGTLSDLDGENITTETARFTDEGGVIVRSPTIDPTNENVLADNPVHPGVDEDTE